MRKLEVDYVLGQMCLVDIRRRADTFRHQYEVILLRSLTLTPTLTQYEAMPWRSGARRGRMLARAVAHMRWYAHLVVFNRFLHDTSKLEGECFSTWLQATALWRHTTTP